MTIRLRHLLVVLLLAASPVVADEIPRAALGSRAVRFTYTASFSPPAGSGVVELWLPLPREEDQVIRDLRLTGSGHPRIVVLHPSGDRVAYVRVERPAGGPVALTETATVVRQEIAGTPDMASPGDDIDTAVFADDLRPSSFVLVNDELRTIARQNTEGARSTVTRARALYDWVYDHMQYDKSVPGWGLGDVPYCLKVGKGNCTDFHTLFVALARASGIPARWSIGFPLAYGTSATEQAVSGYHCWAEFWAPGAGWVPVDISEARKHPELKDYFFGHLSGNRVLFSRARDFVLDPDATSARRNYLVYPVARVDGKDATGVDWSFRYRDLAAAD